MTHIRQLFQYIKDLYNTSNAVFQFENEPHNAKQKNAQYFILDEWVDLYTMAQKENNGNMQLQIERPDESLLTLKRAVIPDLTVPNDLIGWTETIVPFGNLLPVLQPISERKNVINFGDDTQRSLVWFLWKAENLHNPDATPLPTLANWVIWKPNPNLSLEENQTENSTPTDEITPETTDNILAEETATDTESPETEDISNEINNNDVIETYSEIEENQETEETAEIDSADITTEADTTIENIVITPQPPPPLGTWEIIPQRVETERFDENGSRVRTFERYKNTFSEYYLKWWTNIRINQIYEQLHTLYYELKSRDNKALYLSFGLLNGRIGDEVYRNFIFHVPLRMSVRAQVLKIDFDTFANRIFAEQYFTSLFEEHFRNQQADTRQNSVLAAVDAFNNQTWQFYGTPEFVEQNFVQTAEQMLSVFANLQTRFFKTEADNIQFDYTFYATHDAKDITFSFSPILQTKIVESQILISKDAAKIVQQINELEQNNELHRIPDFFKKLFDLPSETEFTTELQQFKTENEADFLFPLPYNEEQLAIANRLLLQDAVTVKGPPGTGKSHTIANLISHFVAEGKNILVVSHNSKALSVVKDKLPTELQQLTISLGNDTKGNELLKTSVNTIIAHLSKNYTIQQIQDHEQQRQRLQLQYDGLLERIYETVGNNHQELTTWSPISQTIETHNATYWAAIWTQKPATNWQINDLLPTDIAIDDLANKIYELSQLAGGLTAEDLNLARYIFLPDEDLPSVDLFQQIVEQINLTTPLIGYNTTAFLYRKNFASIATHQGEFNLLWHSFLALHDQIQRYPFLVHVFNHRQFSQIQFEKMLEDTHKLREHVSAMDYQLQPYTIELNHVINANAEIALSNLREVMSKFDASGQLTFFQKTFLTPEARAFLTCTINGVNSENLNNLKIIELHLERQKMQQQIKTLVGNYLKPFYIHVTNLDEWLEQLDLLIQYFQIITQINTYLVPLQIPQLRHNNTLPTQIKLIEQQRLVGDYQLLQQQLQDYGKKICPPNVQVHPIAHQLNTTITSRKVADYEKVLLSYKMLRDQQPKILAIQELLNRIALHAPHTSMYLKQQIFSGKTLPEMTHNSLKGQLAYAQIRTFLEAVSPRTLGIDKLFDQLQSLKNTIARQTVWLISHKTWYNKNQQITETAKSALSAWLASLVAIGKGHGRNTVQNMNAAIQNMQVAKSVVPVWIMPQQTAINFFPDATPAQFDLLIVDEASQCDISMLNLIFRAKKTIIVGDENQTSVTANHKIFDFDKVNRLLDTHLYHHPFKTAFNVNNNNSSIYTLSSILYPNIITLTEHFRCLPEIIHWSNQYIYNGLIQPLRTATQKPFGASLGIEYHQAEIDDLVRMVLVERCVEIIESYIEKFEKKRLVRLPSIGILCLDSSNQKHQQALIRAIARNEKIKQHEDALSLLVGTSREFQGDERDVMLLTLTVMPYLTEEGEMRPPRGLFSEEFMRIYNVAASRAKDRCLILHSIPPDLIGLISPDCYRRKLLDYYTLHQFAQIDTPQRQLPELLLDSNPELGEMGQVICQFLYDKGYGKYLNPQYQVGNQVIDFALLLPNTKLAIVCDGYEHQHDTAIIQQKIANQLLLERAGWRFFRLQSMNWWYNHAAVSQNLLSWVKRCEMFG